MDIKLSSFMFGHYPPSLASCTALLSCSGGAISDVHCKKHRLSSVACMLDSQVNSWGSGVSLLTLLVPLGINLGILMKKEDLGFVVRDLRLQWKGLPGSLGPGPCYHGPQQCKTPLINAGLHFLPS